MAAHPGMCPSWARRAPLAGSEEAPTKMTGAQSREAARDLCSKVISDNPAEQSNPSAGERGGC